MLTVYLLDQAKMARFYKLPLTKPYFPRSALSAGNLEYWIGHQEQIDRVVRGLAASNDTHYLITGYPGVGKSSFVSRAIAEWRKVCAAQGISRVLIFNLHFAQPQTPEEVVRRLIGKVYFASVDGEFAPTKKLANRLELNYIQAYSKSLKETQGETSTTESGTDAKLTLPALTGFGGNLGAGSKESKGVSRSLEIQKEYNLNMATSDFESVLHLLTQAKSFESGLFERIKRQFSRSRNDHINSRTLFIFDQMDDLGAVEQLDSFFNMPNASFIVLGGPKLQEETSSARERGVHVLDNFDEIYLPCRWNTAREMLAPLVDSRTVSSRRYLDYSDYLNFCSQGLPRRLFAAMDRHTTRKGDHFYLGVSDSEQKRIKLCAELHRILWKHRKDILGSYIDSVLHPLRDKALRGAYHLTDRIFRVVEFSFQEANTVATQMSATIMHPSRERVLRNLLKLFESYGMLLKSSSGYRLSEGVLKQVKQIPDWLKDGFADANELLDEIRRLDEKVSSSVVDIDLTPRHRVPP
ncbi:MAG TPA: hypothetical protein VGO47_09745 [Chlamydiales bacterium]|nr:hypothetical protein [Chlamydiales bacterium]